MIKKLAVPFIALSLMTAAVACKNKSGEKNSDSTTEKPAAGSETEKPAAPVNQPKTWQISMTPDSVILGKDKEAMVKLLGGEAVETQDPDGKPTGMSVKIKLRTTNKSTLDNKKFFSVNNSDARMELDNGTSTTSKSGDSMNPDPEASLEGVWEFDIPAGTKPAKLNLFLDGTRVSVVLSLS